jgi:hypothetical protein
MGVEEAVFEEICRMKSTVEAGQSTIDNGSKSQFLQVLRLLRESFFIFSSFCL